MFPLDEFEQQTPHNDRDGIEEDAERIPEPKNIDAISNSSEPQRWDSAELAVPDPQGSTEPDGEATGTSEQAIGQEDLLQYSRPRASQAISN